MPSFEFTVLMSLALGALGGFISHGVWLQRLIRTRAESSKVVSKAKEQRNARIALYVLSVSLGAVVGLVVSLIGFQTTANVGVVFALAFAAGVTPTIVGTKVGKLSGV